MDYTNEKENEESNMKKIISNKTLIGNSRLLDNHYDPEIHERAWIAAGKTPDYKYQYSDSGLAYQPKKLKKFENNKNYKEKYEIEEEIKEKLEKEGTKPGGNAPAAGRRFPETENIKDNDIFIFIEYCTNCKEHSSSTRHDEEKYLKTAVKLREFLLMQFPIVKVFLKPLLFDVTDRSLESLYQQKRIGAFEVQICSRLQGTIKHKLIYSKLATKKWPKISEIISQIPPFLHKCNLIIELQLDEEEMEKLDDIERENKLKGIEIILTPFRNKIDPEDEPSMSKTNTTFLKSRPISGFSNRPVSGFTRPKSAFSTVSNKTFTSLHNKLANESPQDKENQIALKALSDSRGKVFFKEIPHDVYTLELPETNDFLSDKISINIFEMIENNTPLYVKLMLRKQNLAFLFLQLVDGFILVNEGHVEIRAYDGGENQKATIMKETPPNSGKYELVLDQGDYRLFIKREGYENINKVISVKSGTNNIKIPMVQKLVSSPVDPYGGEEFEDPMREKAERVKSTKHLHIYVYDATNNKGISNLEDDTFKNILSYSTDKNGDAHIPLKNVLEGKMIIENPMYFRIEEQYKPTKLNLHAMKDLSFPLIKKPKNPNEMHVLINTAFREKLLEMNLICPDNSILKQTKKDIEIENNFQEGYGFIKIKNIQGIYRFFVRLFNPDIFNPQFLKVYIINEKELKLIEIPKAIPASVDKAKYWDIGIIQAPQQQFFEINAATTKEIGRDTYLKSFQELLSFVSNSKSVDLKAILGFNHKDKLEQNDDTFVSKDKILNSLDKYGYEYNKSDIEHLIASALHSNGLYSYQKLEKKLAGAQTHKFVEQKPREKGEESDDDEYLDEFENI